MDYCFKARMKGKKFIVDCAAAVAAAAAVRVGERPAADH